jgi:hypothetical protein
MYAQPRFSVVTPAQVRGHLKATGSVDSDVLLAARDQLAAPYRPLKWFGIWAIVTGTLCCLLIILAIIGVPLIVFGVWAIRRSRRNAATIENTFNEFVAALGTGMPTDAIRAGGSINSRAIGLGLLALAMAGDVSAQGKQVEPEWRGDYVAVQASCSSSVRLRLGEDHITLANGRDSAVFRDLDFSYSYYGHDYTGIQFVAMPEYTSSTASSDGYPFLVQFNDGEQRGRLRVLDDMRPALARRFPIADVPLKRCDAGG